MTTHMLQRASTRAIRSAAASFVSLFCLSLLSPSSVSRPSCHVPCGKSSAVLCLFARAHRRFPQFHSTALVTCAPCHTWISALVPRCGILVSQLWRMEKRSADAEEGAVKSDSTLHYTACVEFSDAAASMVFWGRRAAFAMPQPPARDLPRVGMGNNSARTRAVAPSTRS